MEIHSNQNNPASDIIINDIVSVNHDIREKNWTYTRRPFRFYEMHYVMSGSFSTEYDDNLIHLEADSLLFIPPQLTGTTFSKALPTEIIGVYFTAELPECFNNLFSDIFYIQNCIPEVRKSFRNIKHIYYSRKDNYQIKIKKELYDILEIISDKLNETTVKSTNYYTVRAAETYIKEKYLKTDISVDFLARLCKITPAYFSRIFKDVFGMSPKKYIIDLKMKMAKELLEYTTTPISEISKNLGYNELAYFTTTFKNHFGVTPTQYRHK